MVQPTGFAWVGYGSDKGSISFAYVAAQDDSIGGFFDSPIRQDGGRSMLRPYDGSTWVQRIAIRLKSNPQKCRDTSS